MANAVVVAALLFGGLCIAAGMIVSGRPIRTLLKSSAAGLTALALVNFSGSALTGVTLAVNLATIGVSCLCGIPGVVGMLFMDAMI